MEKRNPAKSPPAFKPAKILSRPAANEFQDLLKVARGYPGRLLVTGLSVPRRLLAKREADDKDESFTHSLAWSIQKYIRVTPNDIPLRMHRFYDATMITLSPQV